jgi:hypothetical protein
LGSAQAGTTDFIYAPDAGALVSAGAGIRKLFQKILSRDPSAEEIELAKGYLQDGSLSQYAQVLLSTNEKIFWP